MKSQSESWSQAASIYESEFVNPYRDDVSSPLLPALEQLAKPDGGRAADLGCGIGPLLPILAQRFQWVHAVDFAPGMLERARLHCQNLHNIDFHMLPLTDLTPLHGTIDVAVAVNSFVMPDLDDLERSLRQVRRCLRPGGTFLGILPAMDAVHYHTMLAVDRARARGLPLEAARKNAAAIGEHKIYDFAFGQCRFRGLEQHFWQPFEVRYRLRRAGFRLTRLARVRLAWAQLGAGLDLAKFPAPWDWFFQATCLPRNSSRNRKESSHV